MAPPHDGNPRGNNEERPVQYVQLNALVVMQIIKQCEEQRTAGEHAQGYVCGLLEEDGRLEITFAYPSLRAAEGTDEEKEDYAEEMSRRLRQVNIDNLVVGWYKSAVFGSFLNREVFESQFEYQSNVEESVVLVYDPVRTGQGLMTLKAYRLGPEVMRVMKKDGIEFTMDSVKRSKISIESLFEEVPVRIKNSHFTNAMLSELDIVAPSPNKRPFLDLSTSTLLEKNVGLLLEGVEHLLAENQKLSLHQKRIQRLEYDRRRIVQRRNDERRQKGEPELTQDEITNLLRPLPDAPRADLILLSAQVGQYCDRIGQFSVQSLSKMQMAEALQGRTKDSSAAYLASIHKEAQQ